jgi:hypothetical protein
MLDRPAQALIQPLLQRGLKLVHLIAAQLALVAFEAFFTATVDSANCLVARGGGQNRRKQCRVQLAIVAQCINIGININKTREQTNKSAWNTKHEQETTTSTIIIIIIMGLRAYRREG